MTTSGGLQSPSMWKDVLMQSGRSDPVVLAVLFTESRFRPKFVRIVEIVSWLLLRYIAPARARAMTLGIAQAKLSAWESYWQDTASFAMRLSALECPVANYDVCQRVIVQLHPSVRANTEAVTKHYTGTDNLYYTYLLDRWIEEFDATRDYAVSGPHSLAAGCKVTL